MGKIQISAKGGAVSVGSIEEALAVIACEKQNLLIHLLVRFLRTYPEIESG